MKQIDMRFNQNMLKQMIGESFTKYKADPFVYTPSVTQIIGLFIGNAAYKLTNVQETVDYFGTEDDEAVFKISPCEAEDIKSCFEGVNQINIPINETIKTVTLVNENQKLFRDGEQLYDVWLTRGIIFGFAEHEISFVKDCVPFSEEIEIQKGYELIDKIEGTEDFLEGWDEGLTPQCFRQIVKIE